MAKLLSNGICRCCSSEGTFKDVKSKYHWMGAEEIYIDMLKDCFDISLYTEDCEDSGICEVCITQLRNAANFKKQVLHTEEQFLRAIANKSYQYLEDESIPVKTEQPKVEEVEDLSDHYVDGDPEFVPVFKGEVTDKSEQEDEEETKPKVRKRVIKAAPSSSKRTKKVAGETKTKRTRHVNAERTNQIVTEESGNVSAKNKVKRKRIRKPTEELLKHLYNAKEIMKYTNATAIHHHDGVGYVCCFCSDVYLDARDLKFHTLETHDIVKEWEKFKFNPKMENHLLRLDVTSLECRLCEKEFIFDEMIDHLAEAHGVFFHKDIQNHIVPFDFGSDTLKCVRCASVFNKFKTLLEHMCSHYGNYTCEICGACSVNKRKYLTHKAVHEVGTYFCDHCDKVFTTIRKKRAHENRSHLHIESHKCALCNLKFIDYDKKLKHLKEDHGIERSLSYCQSCGKGYGTKTALKIHIERCHLMLRPHGCGKCEQKFFSVDDLNDHMAKHDSEKRFICEICSKGFGSKKRLSAHSKMHKAVRKHNCIYCGFSTIYRSCWNNHMLVQHNEQV